MKEQPVLQETYSDLLHNETDLAFIQLVQGLENICSAPQPPASVNWPAVRAMHTEQTMWKRAPILPFRIPAHQRHLLFRRAVFVPVLIGLVLVTAAFTIVLSPLLRTVLSVEPSSQGLISNGSFVDIHQSQTIEGATVTLEEGYVDSNQVILGYTVSPIDAHIAFRGMNLRTQDGIDLMNQGGDLRIAYSASDRNTSATSLFFNTSAIKGKPHALDLRLSILIGQAIIGTPTKGPAYKILGTINFNFTLPFHPGRVATPEQQATSHGKKVTLERVIVSQAATRIVVQGIGTCGCGSTAILQVPGDTHNYDYGFASPGADGPSAWSFVYPFDFSKSQGTWTLTIKTGIYTWVFHFVVPA